MSHGSNSTGALPKAASSSQGIAAHHGLCLPARKEACCRCPMSSTELLLHGIVTELSFPGCSASGLEVGVFGSRRRGASTGLGGKGLLVPEPYGSRSSRYHETHEQDAVGTALVGAERHHWFAAWG